MIYNPGKLQSAADALSRCGPLDTFYVSVDQEKDVDHDDELEECLELDLEDVHVAINLVNCDEEVNMMSWEVIHRANQEDFHQL